MKLKSLRITVTVLTFMLINSLSIMAEEEISAEVEAYWQQMADLWDGLDKKTGDVTLPNGVAKLSLGNDFIYLNADGANTVLVDMWGNIPGDSYQGLIMPKDSTPFDEGSWAVIVDYEEDGYISDEDAGSIKYDKILKQMKKETKQSSDYRVSEGYEAIELIGWAASPHYDAATKKLHWAKELYFEGTDVNTLNYDIRALGRKGVLVMSFVASIDQLEQINHVIEPVIAMAEFTPGNTYADFDPSMDKVAAYGLGALVAGKLAAKTGLLAAALIALKKFWIILLVGIGAFFKKIVGSKKTEE